MKVEITLVDDEGEEVLLVRSCLDDPELVNLTITGTGLSINVRVEDLKHALRKLCTK